MKQKFEDNYKKLIVWQNAAELRKFVYEMTGHFPKQEYCRVSQMRDAARSVKQNIQEGRKRKSELEFLRFLDISRGSLSELKGDIDDCYEDGLITENPYGVAIDLICRTDYLFHQLMKAIRGSLKKPLSPFKPLQRLKPL